MRAERVCTRRASELLYRLAPLEIRLTIDFLLPRIDRLCACGDLRGPLTLELLWVVALAH
jgi:hypothetical protein